MDRVDVFTAGDLFRCSVGPCALTLVAVQFDVFQSKMPTLISSLVPITGFTLALRWPW